jgi:hypothetical protein
MLMSLQQGLYMKTQLQGDGEFPNKFWNVTRVETLKTLYEGEKGTKVKYINDDYTIGALSQFLVNKHLKKDG